MALRTRTQPLLAQALAHLPPRAPALSLARRYHPTPHPAAYKDDQDRQSLKPRRAETTKSGTDDEVAAQTDAAFNPKKTSPEEAKASAAGNGNPLDASGANREFSKSPKADAAVEGKGEKARSGVGKGKKHGKVGPVE